MPKSLPRSLPRHLLLSTVVSITFGCAGTQVPETRIASPGEALFNGRVKPEVNCYKCHNGDGTGTWRGPNLSKRVPGLDDLQIAQAIADGPGLMPSFKGKVTDEQTGQLVAFLRGRFPH